MVGELEGLKNLIKQPPMNNGDEVSVSKSHSSFFTNKNGFESGYQKMENEGK